MSPLHRTTCHRELCRIWHSRTFKLVVIASLFALAFYLKGEPVTTTTLIGRIFDALGDVAADAAIHGGQS